MYYVFKNYPFPIEMVDEIKVVCSDFQLVTLWSYVKLFQEWKVLNKKIR